MNNIKSCICILLFAVVFSGCRDKVEPVKEVPVIETRAKEPQALVTFVELGSVKCIPCKMMKPVMEGIEKDYEGQVKVVFYDVWTEQGRPYSDKYGVKAIPTQVFLDKDGKEFHRHVGFYPQKDIEKMLEENGVIKK